MRQYSKWHLVLKWDNRILSFILQAHVELALSRNNVLFRSFNVIWVIQNIWDSLGAMSAWTRCWSQTIIAIHKAIIIWFCHYLSIPRLNTLLFDLYLRAWLTQSNLIKIAAREFFKIIIFYWTVFNRHFCIVIMHFPAKLCASFLWLHFWVDYNHIYHISQHCRCSFFLLFNCWPSPFV